MTRRRGGRASTPSAGDVARDRYRELMAQVLRAGWRGLVAGSARARRERYVGAWPPEPLPDHTEWARAGGARIAQYMVAVADRAPGLELLEGSVDGVPGLVARRAGVVMTVASFDVSDGRVTRIWVVRGPEKLRPWAREGRPAPARRSVQSPPAGRCS